MFAIGQTFQTYNVCFKKAFHQGELQDLIRARLSAVQSLTMNSSNTFTLSLENNGACSIMFTLEGCQEGMEQSSSLDLLNAFNYILQSK